MFSGQNSWALFSSLLTHVSGEVWGTSIIICWIWSIVPLVSNLMLMVSVFACFVSMFQIIIWDYYQKSKSTKLTNLNETLEEAQINMDHEVWCSLSIFLLRSPPRHCIVACFAVTFECSFLVIFFSYTLFCMPSVIGETWFIIDIFGSFLPNILWQAFSWLPQL